MRKIGVVLLNLGGPNNEEAVQPFLYNLFMDEDIIKIPLKGGVKRGLIKFVTTQRAKVVAKKYKEINACPNGCLGPKSCSNRQANRVSDCCSATNPLTEGQRRALSKQLEKNSEEDVEYIVLTAMRYWHPMTDHVLDELDKEGVEEVILLPLYPQFSYSTTASSWNEWTRRVRARGWEDKWKVHFIKDYHLHPKYIAAVNQRIDEGLLQFPEEVRDEVHLLFSAHGTPISFREAGDPYSFQIKATMEAVMEARAHDRPHWLSFQSRVGPVKWLEPNTEEFLDVLHGYGLNHLLVIPIAFVSDHIETSMEIEIEFKEVADELGIENFICTRGINDMPMFIEALGDIVRENTSKKLPESVEAKI
ncbi:MAG: ferrochelatase [Bacteroidia bacterium]|nr:ferrochelatase [Bacteroidia bacterium]